MKNVILITMLTLMVLSCKKEEEVKPNVCMECAVITINHVPFSYSCDTGSFETYCDEQLNIILKEKSTHVGDIYSYWYCKNN